MNIKNIKVILKELNYSEYAINALFSERIYQENLWKKENAVTNCNKSEIAYLVLIQDYITEAIHVVSRNTKDKSAKKGSEIIRKITGLALGSAEKNNCVEKDLNFLEYTIIDDDLDLIKGLALMQHYINKGFEDYASNHRSKERKIQVNVSYIFAIGMKIMSISKKHAPMRHI